MHVSPRGDYIDRKERRERRRGKFFIRDIHNSLEITKRLPKCEIIWASPRELLNIFQADSVGCHIITATNDILKKLSLVDKDLDQYSLETVQMFYKDAQVAGYKIELAD